MASQNYAQQAFQFFTGKGYSPIVAAALVGNMQQESSFNPTAQGAAGEYGVNQWLGDRRMNFENYATKQGTSLEDFQTQLGFTDHELNTTERKAGDALRSYKGNDVAEATKMVSDMYLRPGDPRLENRTKYAQDVLAQAGIDTTGWSPEMVEGALSRVAPQDQGILATQPVQQNMMQQAGPTAGNTQEVESAPNERSFWGKVDEFLKRPEQDGRPSTSDALLALGSGLLSGRNWAEGGAAAGQNLLALRQQARENQQRDNAIGARGAGSNKYRQTGNVSLKPGNPLGVNSTYAIFDENTGRILTPTGEDISEYVQEGINRSDAQGSQGRPSQGDVGKLRTRLRERETSLNTINRVMSRYENFDMGVDNLTNELSHMWKTFTGLGEFTEEEIQQAVQRGEIMSLVGQVKEPMGQTGVLTNQDFANIITGLGGNARYLTNPQVAREILKVHLEETQANYQADLDYYGYLVENFPNQNIPEWKSHLVTPGAKTPPPAGTGILTEQLPPPGATGDVSDDDLIQKYL